MLPPFRLYLSGEYGSVSKSCTRHTAPINPTARSEPRRMVGYIFGMRNELRPIFGVVIDALFQAALVGLSAGMVSFLTNHALVDCPESA